MFRFVVSRDRRDRRDRHACGLLCTSLHPMFQLHFLLVGTVSGTWPCTGAAMVLGGRGINALEAATLVGVENDGVGRSKCFT